MVAVLGNKKEFIFRAVEEMYTEVASCPGKGFHFPTGRLACLFVGYPAQQLDAIVDSAVESFAGVGYPFSVGGIHTGDCVLDVGSGSGTDALIAATLVGPGGTVYRPARLLFGQQQCRHAPGGGLTWGAGGGNRGGQAGVSGRCTAWSNVG